MRHLQHRNTQHEKTLVFIHGAWLTRRSWEEFTPAFEQKGYTILIPEWPYRDQPIETLRANTPPELAEIGVQELTDHFEAVIRKLPEPPILIGHSFGGLIEQLLPAHVVKSNYEHYKQSTARTEFHEFAGRSHFLVAGEGREEVINFIAHWIEHVAV